MTVTHGGRALDAMVVLASGNGQSIAIMYEGVIAGFIGMAPLIAREDGWWQTLNGARVELVRMVRE